MQHMCQNEALSSISLFGAEVFYKLCNYRIMDADTLIHFHKALKKPFVSSIGMAVVCFVERV